MSLEVKNLRVSFNTYLGKVQAVRGISFYVEKGETVGIVGESGSGKSVTAQSIMKLLPTPPAIIESGEIYLDGEELLKKTDKQMQSFRGNAVGMIFQDPMTSLNPTMRIGNQLIEGLIQHKGLNKKEARKQALEMFQLVGISDPEKRI